MDRAAVERPAVDHAAEARNVRKAYLVRRLAELRPLAGQAEAARLRCEAAKAKLREITELLRRNSAAAYDEHVEAAGRAEAAAGEIKAMEAELAGLGGGAPGETL